MQASDADMGDNARVRYRLSTRSRAQYGQLFHVNQHTGEVRLLQPVDYERLPRRGVVVAVMFVLGLSLGSGLGQLAFALALRVTGWWWCRW